MQDDGVRVISRAATLLRLVAAQGPGGCTTSEIARLAHIARPTVHRLLTALHEEGFLDRERQSGRWSIGPEMFLLGRESSEHYRAITRGQELVTSIARRSGECTFLSARRADETVCLLREEGSFPLRSHVMHDGVRLPLAVASAGMAILAQLPDREVREYLDSVDLVPQWGAMYSRDKVETRIAETRAQGYAVIPGLVAPGCWAIAAAVFNARREPMWSLSITAVEARTGDGRLERLGQSLLDEAHHLSQTLAGMASRAPATPMPLS
ncbi:IclR family transcriptional regulator [Amycolatopsis acidicola]|uniref:IclR family transcriptional regulator n=1 Tax=Amycolatopsis acidicola TaxID=2596893 RepID=A0A5N0VIA2_9PSEU|nr:IclR family transcriptional regulator [Amycolatopsis acidicola]KAA9164402.1 IclR family transcriptional regulator [Amycolatopsis acidicola]